MRASRASDSTDQSYQGPNDCLYGFAEVLVRYGSQPPLLAEPRSYLRKPEWRRQTVIHKDNRSSAMKLYRAERFPPPKDPGRIGRHDFDLVQGAGAENEAE